MHVFKRGIRYILCQIRVPWPGSIDSGCPGWMHLFVFDTGMKQKKVLNQCIYQMNLGYQVSYSKQKGLCYGLQMLSDAFQGGFLLISCVIAVSSI